jgi:hypothetical protein
MGVIASSIFEMLAKFSEYRNLPTFFCCFYVIIGVEVSIIFQLLP